MSKYIINSVFQFLIISVLIIVSTNCKKENKTPNIVNTPISPVFGSFTDARDGYVYKTVEISNQVWMAENLKYLPNVVGPDSVSATLPICYVYDYDGTDVNSAKATVNYNTYGVLYNWSAAMNGASNSNSNPSNVQGVCPNGWHLPSHSEWLQLTSTLLDASENEGGKLKAIGILQESTGLWETPNTGATNETGFTGLPSGELTSDFSRLGSIGVWWSSTEWHGNELYTRELRKSSGILWWSSSRIKKHGYSVRCVKD